MKKFALLISLALTLPSLMLAADPWSKCVACHGQTGEKQALGKSKVIKDFTKEEIKVALNGYKDGTYGGAMKTVMQGQAKTLSEEDINLIAEKIGK